MEREKLFDDIDRYRDERDNRDDDYSADLWKERFRRDNPGWTEEEYQSYFEKKESL